jgi:imidazoleglycerol phosphate dehydratase HisB
LDVRRVATLLDDKVQTVVDHYLPMSEALAQQAADILNRPVPAVRRALVPVETDRRDSASAAPVYRN